MSPERPGWIAFDLNGTLVEPGALFPDLDAAVGRRCLADAVKRAMSHTLAGAYEPFEDLQREALERTLALEEPRSQCRHRLGDGQGIQA